MSTRYRIFSCPAADFSAKLPSSIERRVMGREKDGGVLEQIGRVGDLNSTIVLTSPQ